MSDDWTKSRYYSIDPYRDIAPSLLNSADILRYARKGCLVHPFDYDEDMLDPATYAMKFLGRLHWWEDKDDERIPQEAEVMEGKPIRLQANSITYLQTKEEFRLPQYVAARFNLHIEHVHRGILLGTGPLVDPGFVGPILIPLHNLTDKPYDLMGGEKLLWIEFTKLTSHAHWRRPHACRDTSPPPDLITFSSVKGLSAKEYFDKSQVSGMGVVSAFKGALERAQSDASSSERAVKQAKKSVQTLSLIGIATLAIGVGTLVFAAFELFQNNSEMAGRIHDRLDRIERATNLLPRHVVESVGSGGSDPVELPEPESGTTVGGVTDALDDSMRADDAIGVQSDAPSRE